MKLMDILKKLGIVRCEGHAGVYTSAKDRPLDFIDDLDTEQGPAASIDTTPSQSD